MCLHSIKSAYYIQSCFYMVQAGAWQQRGAPKLPEAKTSKLACGPESDRHEESNKTRKWVKVFVFVFLCE